MSTQGMDLGESPLLGLTIQNPKTFNIYFQSYVFPYLTP